MPGKKYASLGRPDIYEALRRDNPKMSKEMAAKIANSHATAANWDTPPSERPGGLGQDTKKPKRRMFGKGSP